ASAWVLSNDSNNPAASIKLRASSRHPCSSARRTRRGPRRHRSRRQRHRSETAPSQPQNPLYERYASRQMAGLFSAERRFAEWRRLWVALAECEMELGLPITAAQGARPPPAPPPPPLRRPRVARETPT